MRPRYQSAAWLMAAVACAGVTPAVAQDAASPAPVDAAERRPPVVTNPTWSRAPGLEYPERALSEDVRSGVVQLDCGFTADGALTSCVITEETPAGMGFGAAALRGVRSARLAPVTIDRVPPDARIRFPVRFALGG